MTLPGCGAIGMSAKTFVPAPWVWSCAVREAGLETPQVSGNTATFVANGTLWYTGFTATLTVTASLDESYQPAEVIVSPQSYSLNCNGFTTVTVDLLNGRGEPYLPCGNAPILATATIAAKGPYAYLEGNGQSGQTIDILISNGQGAFLSVLDTSRGIIPDGSDVGIINVSTQGVIGENAISLTCQYPPPSVAIVYPGQDTTIVLTPTHQPELRLIEEHSPPTGQFEPSITWDPADVIVTADYYAQITDSLVLPINVTAENEGGTATHERKIVLKRACNLPPPRYPQGGTASWADSLYDKSSTGTISGWGCALSSMAMVMTAFGDTVNPGELNAWMKERSRGEGGFGDLRVNWRAMELHSPNKMTFIAFDKKQFKDKPNKLLDSTQVTHPSVLDEALGQCKLVIVQVFNDRSSRSGEHWVVVTGKENDKYKIIDPGSRNEEYLGGYGSFWKYLVVEKSSE